MSEPTPEDDNTSRAFTDLINATRGTTRPAPPAPTPAPETTPAEVVPINRTTTPAAPKNTKNPGQRKTPKDNELIDAAVWLPTHLKQALDADLGSEGVTISERVVQAFNTQYDNLTRMFPAAAASTGPMPTFTSTRRRRSPAGSTTLVRIRLRPQQKKVLDDAVRAYNTNRSLLVTKILSADLGVSEHPPTTAKKVSGTKS